MSECGCAWIAAGNSSSTCCCGHPEGHAGAHACNLCPETLGKTREELQQELAEAKEQIAAYQVRVDNDALRLANLAHPITADRFSR